METSLLMSEQVRMQLIKNRGDSSLLPLCYYGSSTSPLISSHAFTSALKPGWDNYSQLLILIPTPNAAIPQASLCTGLNSIECFFSEEKKKHNQ